MFICKDKCINLYNNVGFFTSIGPCEICGERKECYDIPSKYLELKSTKQNNIERQSKMLDDLAIALSIVGKLPVEKDPDKEEFTDDFGHTLINVHRERDCNPPCTIHAHSEHELSNRPLLWRNDRGIFEHMCEHGIGHPCPDSLPETDSGVHGCDGCCTEGGPYESEGIESRR